MYRCVSLGPELCYSLKWMLRVPAGTIPASTQSANDRGTRSSLQRVCVCDVHTPQTCGFPGSSEGKESACNWETWVRFLGWEDPLEKGMATRVRILAWKSPLIEEPGMLQSVGSQRVGHDWVTNTFTFRISEAPEQRPLWPEGWRWPLNTFMDGEIWETRFLVSPSINPSIFSSIHLLKTKTKTTETTLWNLLCTRWASQGASGKESACQCRRHKRRRFDPWVGKMPWRSLDRGAWRAAKSQTRAKWLSACTRAPGTVLGAAVPAWAIENPFGGRNREGWMDG